MALSFNTTTSALEEELIQLILDGQIQARIDSQNKVINFQINLIIMILELKLVWTMQILYAKDIDQRSATFEKSIEMGKEYQKRTKAVILRSLIMKYNICVKVKSILKTFIFVT